ncbi:MAG: hypothetical protein RSD77_08290 [Romboutsia sp.]
MEVFMLVLAALLAICLQIFLCKAQCNWCGLILPIITILYSVLMLLNIKALENQPSSHISYTFIATVIFLGIYFYCKRKKKQNDKK